MHIPLGGPTRVPACASRPAIIENLPVPPSPIKAILFDLGDVIIGLDFARAHRAAAELSPYSADEIPVIIRQAGLANPYERGEVTSEVFHRRFCDALDMDMSFDRFSQLWGDMFEPEPLLDDAFLGGLAGRYRLVLLSNTNELHLEFIRDHYTILQHFEELVLSYRVGVMKPRPEIYIEAVRRSRCEPKECFYTDDKLENVVAGARFGMKAVVFENPAQLRSSLARSGVHWGATSR